jgi:hypothetical protein
MNGCRASQELDLEKLAWDLQEFENSYKHLVSKDPRQGSDITLQPCRTCVTSLLWGLLACTEAVERRAS